MAERFQISAGWMAVIVTVLLASAGALYILGSFTGETKTRMDNFEARATKMEAKLDAIALQVGVRTAVASCPSQPSMQNAGILFPIPTELPPKQATLAGWP